MHDTSPTLVPLRRFRQHSKPVIARARKLRREPTEAEKKLWHCLSRKQTGYYFRRQHPIAGYYVDFVCLSKRLIIELDGGQHALERKKDFIRTQRLQANGYHVARFWNNDVMENLPGVMQSLMKILAES